jgi:hypothetical protein
MPDRTPVTAMNVGPLSGTLIVLLTMFSALTRPINKVGLSFFKLGKEKQVKATLISSI